MLNPRLLLALGLLLPASVARAAEVMVFAAASLTNVLEEQGRLFTAATGHTVRFNFGSSGALARQIDEGAPADVFVSADEARMDRLARAGLLLEGTRRAVAANILVVVVAAEDGTSVAGLSDLSSATVRRIAIGDPAIVPAGTYAKEFLEKVGAWEKLRARLLPLENVRAVLAAVEAGNAEAGFVYKTDALISKKVRVVLEIPPPVGPIIVYPAAATSGTKQPAAARAFIEFLATPEAQAVFIRFGFLAPPVVGR